ncbi:hypothetical protein DL546_001492 [Coniochaeta pulveracea]|uniref:Uncharacterized protein n=1 Tax=Coniochaeta pulveracea TaxID=177199 RepID=A0A420YNH5_9PEZI|nr:hypothetical protein DL546_001492 [Coniochaeta pulveracea]
MRGWLLTGSAYCFQKKSFRGRYSRNLGNTVCVVLACLVGSTALYWTTWYPNLRRDVITTSTDTVNSTYYPSIALFQRLDWSSQGHLTVDNLPPKCFLGWYNDAAPDCDSIAVPGSALPCKCDTRWDSSVTELFVWEDTTYRLLILHASRGMISLHPTTAMLAEVWFTYNSTKALADAGRVLSPSLWVAMFDPTLDITEALERGYTRMQLVDANALVAINLGLQLRESAGQTPAFDYELSISTIPSVSKVEDDDTGWLSLFLQFPSFTRQVSNQHKAWSWSDAIAAAGSWFGLFTLLGWMTSRLATME